MININVKIEDNGNIVTVTIPQTIPAEKHFAFETSLQQLEDLLGTAERTPIDHYEQEHSHHHEHTHTH